MNVYKYECKQEFKENDERNDTTESAISRGLNILHALTPTFLLPLIFS